jgi:hypothetical protein
MPPTNYPYQYPYSYHQPSKGEQIALGVGSLISGLLSAAGGNNTGNAIGRGVAGMVGGYGSGWNQYQNQMGDAYQRFMAEQDYNRRLEEDKRQAETLGLGQEKFKYEKQQDIKYNNPYMDALTQNLLNKPKTSMTDTILNRKMERQELRGKSLQNQEKQIKIKQMIEGKEPDDILNRNQTANIAHNIRNEIRMNPYVKDFQDVNQKYNVMLKALDESYNTGNLIAVDQSLITLFNKMNDPTSVVRESEYARTASDQAMLNKIAGKITKIGKGGAGLMPEEREALVRMSGQFHDIYKSNYDDNIARYSQLAKESGINPSLIDIPFKRKANIQPDQSGQNATSNISPEQAREMIKNLAINGSPEEKQKAIQYLNSKGIK